MADDAEQPQPPPERPLADAEHEAADLQSSGLPKTVEYLTSFSQRHDVLKDLLQGIPGQPPAGSPGQEPPFTTAPDRAATPEVLRISCPHCRHLVEVVVDAPLTDLECPSCGSHFDLTSSQVGQAKERFRPGTLVGRFELVELVGSGRFGSVWKARDPQLDRMVAVKIPRRGQLDPSEAALFLREARAAAQMHHPNIVGVHEIGREEDWIYIVSDFIEGANLKHWTAAKKPSHGQAAQLCATIADALHVAHESGVTHRDLKPSNILIDAAGAPHVADFGLAKRTSGEITMTAEGQILGTPAYMSPEQASGRGHQADRRADVYSLGVILYELLSGELPFRGDEQMLIVQILGDEPPSPRKYNARIPRDLETICLKCLEKGPRHRYQTAQDLFQDLCRFLSNQPIRARPISWLARTGRWCRRNPVVASLCAALFVAILGGLIGTSSQWLRAARRAASETEARQRAELDKQRAIEATRRAEVAQAETKREYSRAEFSLYLNRVALAHRDWLTNDVAGAEAALDACPSALRGWEWRYLKHLCHLDLLTLEHRGFAKSVAFSPDGKRIATAGDGAEIWDSSTGKRLLSILSHKEFCHSVAFSPDGRLVAAATNQGSGSQDRPLAKTAAVKIWDSTTGKELQSFAAKPNWSMQCVAFSPDGKHLAGGAGGVLDPNGRSSMMFRLPDTETPIILWEVATGKAVRHFGEGTGGVWKVAFNPDGTRIAASSSFLGIAKVWDVASGKVLLALAGHRGQMQSVAYSPDGKWIATIGSDATIRVWDAETGKEYRFFGGLGREAQCVAFGPKGAQLAAGGMDNAVHLWNLTDGKESHVFRGHSEPVYGLAFSPDGTKIVSGSMDGTAKVWDTTRPPDFIPGDPGVGQIAFSPDGMRIAFGTRPNIVRVRSTTTWAEILTLKGLAGLANAVAFSADGRLIATGSDDNTIRVWDATTGVQLHSIKALEKARFLAFCGENKRLLSADLHDKIQILDIATGQEIHTLRCRPCCVAISPDRKRIAYGDAGIVRIWDINEDKELKALFGERCSISSVSFDPTGKRLVTGNWAGIVTAWNVDSGTPLWTTRSHVKQVYSCSFSPDGSRIVTGGVDGTVRLWVAATGEQALLLKEEAFVYSVVFDPTGRRIAVRLGNGATKIYDAPPAAPTDHVDVTMAKADEQRTGYQKGRGISRPDQEAGKPAETGFDPKPGSSSLPRPGRVAGGPDAVATRSPFISPNGSWSFPPRSPPPAIAPFDAKKAEQAEASARKAAETAVHRAENAWAKEAEAHSKAEAASRRALDAQAETEKEKKRTELALYINRIASAQMSWLTMDAAGAEKALDASPSDLRGWEWRYLKRLCHLELLTLSLPGISPVKSVAFSPDGKRIAAAGYTVTISDSSSGEQLLRLDTKERLSHCVTFSPDGKWVAAATLSLRDQSESHDPMFYSIKIWDAATGKEVRSLGTADWSTHSVAFSPDGKHLLSGAAGVLKKGVGPFADHEKPITLF